MDRLKAKFDEFHLAALNHNIIGKHNELLLKSMGLWPKQPRLVRIVLFTLNEIFALSVVVPCGLFLVGAWGDNFSFIIGQLSGFCFFLSFPICYIIVHTRVPQFELLLSEASKTWQILKDDTETSIAMKHSKLGFLLSLGFTSYGATIWISGTTLLLLIPYMDITSPWENQTGPFFVIRANYIIIEQRNHYYLTSAHLSGFMLAFVTSLCGVCSIFLIAVEQTRGFFSVTGYRYRNIVKREGSTNRIQQKSPPQNYFELNDLKSAVILHTQTTKMCDLIEESLYPIALESQVFCVLQLALSYFCILEGDVPFEIKCSLSFIIFGIYTFLMIMGFVGQSITDSSEEVFESICMSDWYLAQPKDRRRLWFIMQRSQSLSVLTAGKISNLSLESFVQLLKMSSSYFGALVSMRT